MQAFNLALDELPTRLLALTVKSPNAFAARLRAQPAPVRVVKQQPVQHHVGVQYHQRPLKCERTLCFGVDGDHAARDLDLVARAGQRARLNEQAAQSQQQIAGLRGQIAQLYIAGVVVYCALSLLIAVPPALRGRP